VIRVLARRLVLAPVLLFLASVLAFAFPWLSGVDPTQAALRARLSERAPDPATVRALEAELGTDRSLVVRYGIWMRDLLRGDLGNSYVDRADVAAKLLGGLSVTTSLLAVALLVGLSVGISLGTLAAAKRGWLDAAITSASQTGISVPEYVVGPVLILAFAVWLGVLPPSGWQSPASMILPSLTLAAPLVALSAQLTRAEVADALAHPSINTAKAKGVGENRVLWRHALPNALTSVVAVVGLWVASLFGGAVIVEVIFDVPGLGRVLYNAVISTDLPVIQGGLVLAVALAVAVNLASDLLQAAIDPRAGSR
jgi:peptide/nickel transport system permease protein